MAKNEHVVDERGNCPRWTKPAQAKHARLTLERLESRCLPSAFFFSTGNPHGKMAAATRPATAGIFNDAAGFPFAPDSFFAFDPRFSGGVFVGAET
jgi:hypothetical protein